MTRSLLAFGLLAAVSAAAILPVHAATDSAAAPDAVPAVAVEMAQAQPPAPPAPGDRAERPRHPPGPEGERGPGGRHGGPGRGPGHDMAFRGNPEERRDKMKEKLAERFAAQEQMLGIKSAQLDVWRSYTSAALALIDGPMPFGKPEGKPDGDKPAEPQAFERADRMADAIIARAEAAKTLKDATAALRSALTPEQLKIAEDFDKGMGGKHHGRGGPGGGWGEHERGPGRGGPGGFEHRRHGPPPPPDAEGDAPQEDDGDAQ